MRRSDSIWHRLIRKPSAFVAVIIVGLTIGVALFAYLIAPDNAPNANSMIVELGARPPGFTIQLLSVPKHQVTQASGWTILNGRPSEYQYIPINGYTVKNDTLRVRHYIDEGLEDTLVFPVSFLNNGSHALSSAPGQPSEALDGRLIKKRTFYLGTDRYGRDVLSRLLIGARVSVSVGVIAVFISLFIGLLLGCLSGYYGGRTDSVIMYIINIFWSLPTLLLVFTITLAIGKGFWEIFVAIGLTMWVGAARLIRGQVLILRQMEFVTAAKALGVSNSRIIVKHILPNIAGPVMVIAASNFATAILIEAGLSFLGIGIQPPQPSWGLMLKEHFNFLLTNQPIQAIIPGLAIMILVFAFNILGNALRDLLDVRLAEKAG